ncbi:MAG: hypothetical protein WC378_02730 [Opitutaceae bacterium]|jgi:hypothetical protein
MLPTVHPAFTSACRLAANLSRNDLLAAAIARGCSHYASFVDPRFVRDLPFIPHVVLGCALLRGLQDVETFNAIRVGAMVLSDLDNSPDAIAAASVELSVTSRAAHIARVGLTNDTHPSYWQEILECISAEINESEIDFLPGASRFCSNGRLAGFGRVLSPHWLRTSFGNNFHGFNEREV